MATTRQNSETFRLRIERSTWKRVKKLAKREGRTPASVVRQAVTDFLSLRDTLATVLQANGLGDRQ